MTDIVRTDKPRPELVSEVIEIELGAWNDRLEQLLTLTREQTAELERLNQDPYANTEQVLGAWCDLNRRQANLTLAMIRQARRFAGYRIKLTVVAKAIEDAMS